MTTPQLSCRLQGFPSNADNISSFNDQFTDLTPVTIQYSYKNDMGDPLAMGFAYLPPSPTLESLRKEVIAMAESDIFDVKKKIEQAARLYGLEMKVKTESLVLRRHWKDGTGDHQWDFCVRNEEEFMRCLEMMQGSRDYFVAFMGDK